jgi:hypothetical protein
VSVIAVRVYGATSYTRVCERCGDRMRISPQHGYDVRSGRKKGRLCLACHNKEQTVYASRTERERLKKRRHRARHTATLDAAKGGGS